jgi:pimeloyl-ACP methyl ester carboxylesterase
MLYQEHSIDLDGRRLYYTDWNPAAARTVLMIHGIFVQSHTWDPIAEPLCRDFRVISPDLRGHGRSDWAIDGYYVADFADDLCRLLDRIGIGEADLVGHSLGARVALAMTDRWAGQVNHLILSDAGPEMARAGLERANTKAAERANRRGFRSREEALAFYREAHPEWSEAFLPLHAEHQLRLNWAGKFVERSDPDLYWVTRGAGRKDNDYLWRCAENLRCPSLLLWGRRSAYFDAALARVYEKRFGGDVTTIECDTGHYVPRENPDFFIEKVRWQLAR